MITTIINGQTQNVKAWLSERQVFRFLNAYQTNVKVRLGNNYVGDWYSPNNTIDIDLTELVRNNPNGTIRFDWGTSNTGYAVLTGVAGSKPVFVPETISGLLIEPPTMMIGELSNYGLSAEMMTEEAGWKYQSDGGAWNNLQQGTPINALFHNVVKVSNGEREVNEIEVDILESGETVTLFYAGQTEGGYKWTWNDKPELLLMSETRDLSQDDVIKLGDEDWGVVAIDPSKDYVIKGVYRTATMCGNTCSLEWKARAGQTKRHTFFVKRLKFDVSEEINIQRSNNTIEQLKSLKSSIIAFIPSLTSYDQYYYGDVLQSSNVKISFDGQNYVPARVVGGSQEVNVERGGKPTEFQVEIIVKEDDAI